MWDFSGRIFVPGDLLASYKTANNWNSALLVDKLRPLASATYDASTYTVTASGRDTLELYVDASLCDSSVYTFTPGAADASHNIMVKSVDPSFGVLDTYNLEILVEGAAPSYSAAAPTFTVNQPTYTYDYDEGTAMVRVRVNISTGQLEGYQG